MPFTLLAHQAPVLPLKMLGPRWWSGTALVLGSIAPDLEYVFQEWPHRGFAHSPSGQLGFCLPATLVLAWVVRRIVARPLAAHLPGGPFRLGDYGLLARGGTSFASLGKDAASALVGSFSHIALDGLTHRDGWAVAAFPSLGAPALAAFGHTLPVFAVLQLVLTLVLAALAASLLFFMGRRRSLEDWSGEEAGPAATSRHSHALLWTPLLLALLAGGAYGLAGLERGEIEPFLHSLVRAFFRASAAGALGLVVGCLLAGRVLRLMPSTTPRPRGAG